MKMPDGSTQEWALLPPGNLPTYRNENWTEQTVHGRLIRQRERQLGPRRREEALRDVHQRSTAVRRKAASSAAASNAGTTTQVTADPNVDYTVHAKNYPVNITGYWDNRYKFHVTVDDFDPKPMPLTAEATARSTRAASTATTRCCDVCRPGLPRIFGSPYPMQVLDSGTHYLMVFMQDNTPRRVWMDGRKPAGGAAAHVDGLLEGPLGRPHARDRDDDARARLARRLGLSDERRQRHADRRALDRRAPTASRSIAR